MLFHANDNDFKQKVIEKKGTVLVDFFAEWCGPCQMLAPIIEEISQDLEVCKVDVDESPLTARMFNIQSIPTLLVFKNGELVNHNVGYMDKDEILNMVK